LQEGKKKGTVLIVRSRDLTADKIEDSAVPFVSGRRGFNCGKLTSIIREVLGVLNCSSLERKVAETFKNAAINDNHLYRLRSEECAKEITGLFSATTDPAASARAFRLAIQDRIASKVVTAPTKASNADYTAAAEWVNSQSSKQGMLKQATLEWLTHRHVELQWWRLQAVCRPMFGQPATTAHTDGRQRHMSDMVFLKYVVPIMQSTGPLKHSVEQWMDVMCAVDMLQNGMLSVDITGEVDRHDDGVMKAVWQGQLPSNGQHPNQRAGYTPFPKDRATAVKYLSTFDLSSRAQEPLGPHRLAADPDQVKAVFRTLKRRIEHHDVTDLRHILVTDEFRLKKEMERVIAAIEAVAGKNENRAFMQSMARLQDGATITPVSSILGDTILIQVVCRENENAATRTRASDIETLFRAMNYTCPILVCYSDTGYQTSETNKMLKDALIDALGSKHDGWVRGQPLPSAYILIEDGASMHSGGDLAHSLKCLSSGLVIHHVAPNSTHFSQLYDRLVFLIAKLLSIKELSLRIQAMCSQRPSNAIARACWCRRVMAGCVIAMDNFNINDCTLEEYRREFIAGFQHDSGAEVAALDRKIDDIFTFAERGRCDELFLLSAIAPAMFVALQPKYVVQSAIMVGLLPPDFVLGRDDNIRPSVWPDHVMRNPLVQLQLKRRENELNFANHQEAAIRNTMASIGLAADQQSLASIPPLSHAGERAALDTVDDAVWCAFRRSRGLDHLEEETSKKFRVLVGDYQIFSKQVAREESRSSALTGFIGFNSRTAAACAALLAQQEQEHTTTSIALAERGIRFGTSKFEAVLERADAATRHLNLWRRSTITTKPFHAKNLRSCCSTAQLEFEAGCVNYQQVDQVLSNLRQFDAIFDIAVEDLRFDLHTLHSLQARATACLPRFLQFQAELEEAPAAIDAAVAHEMVDHLINNDSDAAAALPLEGGNQVLAVVANRRLLQRACSKCGSFEHRSDNRLCPGFPAPVEPAANNVVIP
jgi:hypothetical protein